MYRGDKPSAESELTIKGEFVKREIAGDIILVPVGETALKFNGMITLTETASVIWDALERGATRTEIVDCMLDEFDIDRETVENDVDEFLSKLKQYEFIEIQNELKQPEDNKNTESIFPQIGRKEMI